MPTKSIQTARKKKSADESAEGAPYSPAWIASLEDNRRIRGAIVGRLVSVRETGEPLVDFPGNIFAEVLSARSTLPLGKNKVGREVLLIFEEDDLERPIVIGLLETFGAGKSEPLKCEAVEENLTFTAEHEIVLRCGRASITLSSGGKVLIKGAYILSRSLGTNRIKGGSVQIN